MKCEHWRTYGTLSYDLELFKHVLDIQKRRFMCAITSDSLCTRLQNKCEASQTLFRRTKLKTLQALASAALIPAAQLHNRRAFKRSIPFWASIITVRFWRLNESTCRSSTGNSSSGCKTIRQCARCAPRRCGRLSRHCYFQVVHPNNPQIALLDAYNDCVSKLTDFRNEHLRLIARYIINPRAQGSEKSKVSSLDNTGTGGTDLMMFLKSTRDNTSSSAI